MGDLQKENTTLFQSLEEHTDQWEDAVSISVTWILRGCVIHIRAPLCSEL